MGSRSSHLQDSFCLACLLLLLLSRLPSGVMYATIFVILFWALSEMGNVGEDKAVDVWSKLEKPIPKGSRPVVKLSGLWAKIYSLRQGEQTVEKHFEEFNVVWKELETIRPLPACTCGAKCCCCKYLQEEREEREKLKVVRFLEGLDGDRFHATRSEIMLKGPLPSLDEVYNLVKEAAQKPPSAARPAIPKNTPGKGIEKLDHPFHVHPHPLTLEPAGSPYKCSGCQELGFGSRYRCENRICCVLHEECANVVADNSVVFHRFFPGSNFVFCDKPPGPDESVCAACCKKVHGFVYHCSDTGKHLHPCCFKLKQSFSNKEGEVTIELREKITQKCKKCNSKVIKGGEPTKNNKKRREIEGWSYVSSNGDYCYHISCFKELILDKWKEGYFSESVPTCDPELELTTGKAIVKVRRSPKGLRTTKMLINIVFELIFAVVFGNPPTPLILTALGAISVN